MKRLIVFILIITLLCCLNLNIFKNVTLADIFPNASYEVYIRSSEPVDGFESYQNGNGQVVMCSGENLDYILTNYNFNGYSIKIKGCDVNHILNCLSPLYKTVCCDYIYGYLQDGLDCIKINGLDINFQLAICDDFVLIGFPILLGGY